MRKKIIIAALVLVTIAIAIVAAPDRAECWHCKKERCYYDIECGTYCSCHKGSFEIKGHCVSE